MANTYFQFKQFIIRHDKCAMKVGTDGVLLGAWANVDKVQDALDVGTGTGLIAIMLAQRSSAKIDAVEIDESAYRQAGENVSACPWNQRIYLVNLPFQEYAAKCKKTYDLIVSNPPYFRNQFRPYEESRAVARHDDELSLKDLVFFAGKILKPDGIISVVLPAESMDTYSEYLLQSHLYITRILYVMPLPGRPVKRILVETGRKKKTIEENYLAIESGRRHHYTQQYTDLTSAFYLAF
jgi:tRNA1Val (adenine37-N6)-methyltransferase